MTDTALRDLVTRDPGSTARYTHTVHLPDVDVRLSVTTAESISVVLSEWARCVGRPSAERSVDLLAADSVLPLAPELRYRLVSRLVDVAIESAPAGQLLLHAGGVSDDAGRVMGLCADSGVGKTTAVRELISTYGYVTDELLVVAPDRRVIPFPKPLCVVSRDDPAVKDVVGPDQAGLRHHPECPLTLYALALLDRDDRQTGVELRRLSGAAAVWAVSRHDVRRAQADRPLAIVARLLTALPVVAVTYREAADLVDVLPLLWQDDQAAAVGEVVIPEREALPAGIGSYARATWDDAVVIDGEVLLLRAGEVIHLGPLASALWLSADGMGREDLLRTMTDQFGPPPAGFDVDGMLAELVDGGILAAPLARCDRGDHVVARVGPWSDST